MGVFIVGECEFGGNERVDELGRIFEGSEWIGGSEVVWIEEVSLGK